MVYTTSETYELVRISVFVHRNARVLCNPSIIFRKMFATIGNNISNAFRRLKRWDRKGDQNCSDGWKRADELSSLKCTGTKPWRPESQNDFKLRDALDLFENETDRRSNEIADLEKHKRNFRLALASLQRYGLRQLEQLAESREKNSRLKSALITMEMGSHRRENELGTLRTEVWWLKKEQFDLETERDCLEKKVDQMEKEKVALEDALDALKKKGKTDERVFSPPGLLDVTDNVESRPLGVTCTTSSGLDSEKTEKIGEDRKSH